MITNIIEAVQKRLGFTALKKVDPNEQEVKKPEQSSPEQKLQQAALPAVLAAMMKFSGGEDGISLLSGSEDKDWLSAIYCGKESEAAQKVAEYAGVSPETARKEMETISGESVKLIRENIKTPDAEKLRTFMNDQRHNILGHLPASMKMGDLLNEETFDDRTNKMEGPISSFMHKIENKM